MGCALAAFVDRMGMILPYCFLVFHSFVFIFMLFKVFFVLACIVLFIWKGWKMQPEVADWLLSCKSICKAAFDYLKVIYFTLI